MNKTEIIKEYIKDNITPIWLEGFNLTMFKDMTVVPPEAPRSDFAVLVGANGPIYPKWYKLVMSKQHKPINLLVFESIDLLSDEEQERFLELVKYRRISNVKLPENCCIILTTAKQNQGRINEKLRRFLTYISVDN